MSRVAGRDVPGETSFSVMRRVLTRPEKNGIISLLCRRKPKRVIRRLAELKSSVKRRGCAEKLNKKLDAIKKSLHNLVSLLLTNKTIRGDVPKGAAGKVL